MMKPRVTLSVLSLCLYTHVSAFISHFRKMKGMANGDWVSQLFFAVTKIPYENNLKEEKLYFGSWVESTVDQLRCSGPKVEQSTMQEGCGKELLCSLQPGSGEGEGKGPQGRCTLPGHGPQWPTSSSRASPAYSPHPVPVFRLGWTDQVTALTVQSLLLWIFLH